MTVKKKSKKASPLKKNSPIIKKNNKKPQPSEKVKKPLTDKPEEVKPKNKPEVSLVEKSEIPTKPAVKPTKPEVVIKPKNKPEIPTKPEVVIKPKNKPTKPEAVKKPEKTKVRSPKKKIDFLHDKFKYNVKNSEKERYQSLDNAIIIYGLNDLLSKLKVNFENTKNVIYQEDYNWLKKRYA